MVVVIILSVITATIAPHFVGTFQAALLRGTARTLVTAVRLASSEAVTRNRVVHLVVDAERHRWWMECRGRGSEAAAEQPPIEDVPGAAGELPEKIAVQVRPHGSRAPRASSRSRGPQAEDPERGRTIPFRPDGTAEAYEILLRDPEGYGLALRIHPATARVRTVSLERDPGIDGRVTAHE
jgi:hypothetical protein